MVKDAFELALKKLSIRAYSQEELKNVLTKAGFGCRQTANALEKLAGMGYLNDEDLARDIYSYYTSRKPCGRILLTEKLKQKGIPSRTIDSILETFTAEKELNLAHQLAAKYMAKKPAAAGRSLARYLSARGFSYDIVRKIINCCSSVTNIYGD